MGEKLKESKKEKRISQRVVLLNRIVTHIRQSLDLQAILDTTVAEVRAFLNSDRVKIYKFDEEGNGQVIAESIYRDRLPSLLGLHFPAGDIPPQARELFRKARARSIVNIEHQQISLSEPNRLPSTATGELTVEEVRTSSLKNLLQRPVDPCHVEYLSLMGVQSSVVIPILNDEELWGLLISHNAKPKVFSEEDLQLVQMIANQLEFAISQANLLSQVRQKAQREALLNHISTLLHSTLETKQVMPIVLQEVLNAVDGSGGALLIPDPAEQGANFYTCGCLPELSAGKWGKILSLANSDGQIIAIDDCYQNSELKSLSPALSKTKLRSMLLVPLQYR
ncbi:MAG: GAF domain-containing protein, partial [Prochloraceae cyanobacterium]|nr:GAF domain-containing protein [Prochloraceae cyanobacterium]